MSDNIAQTAKQAFEASQLVDASERTKALLILKEELDKLKQDILEANRRDLEVRWANSCANNDPIDGVQAARAEVKAGKLSESLVKRLDLSTEAKWHALQHGVSEVAGLPDPTGKVTYAMKLDDDLELYRVTCPIGVLLVIFEARPEVIINIASLAIKSGE
jgi:glutamate-5-semialdehyde dehydrogenase